MIIIDEAATAGAISVIHGDCRLGPADAGSDQRTGSRC